MRYPVSYVYFCSDYLRGFIVIRLGVLRLWEFFLLPFLHQFIVLVLLVAFECVVRFTSEHVRQRKIEMTCWITVVPFTIYFKKFKHAEFIFIYMYDCLILNDLLAHNVLWGPVANCFSMIMQPALSELWLSESFFLNFRSNCFLFLLLKFRENQLYPLLVLLSTFIRQINLALHIIGSVISVWALCVFLILLDLFFDVIFEPVGVTGLLVCRWLLPVDILSDNLILDTQWEKTLNWV